ncbi:MAG: hypothetical protein NDI88_17155 [Lysobacter sp.]|nr:hypothetical protein [Lysobacter sp.]
MQALRTLLLALPALVFAACALADANGPYRSLPNLDIRIFGCSPNPGHHVVASDADLAAVLGKFAPHCRGPGFPSMKSGFLASLKAANVAWEREALVVVADWYGTGMARGSLVLGQSRPGVVDATIAWKLPPPPHTPDTAVFRGAFAVRKGAVTAVSVTGKDRTPAILEVPR